jgi:hypothetical protein
VDAKGTLKILPAQDAVGAHGKTYLFVSFEEIHGYRNWDIFEALAPDPTRLDALTWITSYASIYNSPGAPYAQPASRMVTMATKPAVPVAGGDARRNAPENKPVPADKANALAQGKTPGETVHLRMGLRHSKGCPPTVRYPTARRRSTGWILVGIVTVLCTATAQAGVAAHSISSGQIPRSLLR